MPDSNVNNRVEDPKFQKVIFGTFSDGTIRAVLVDDDGKISTNANLQWGDTDISVQNPLPTDGDSVYAKDVDVASSSIGGFSGVITDIFDDLSSIISDNSATNPKSYSVKLLRSITSSKIGMATSSGDFSNVKILLKDPTGATRQTIDDSSNNTKYTANVYPIENTIEFCEYEVQFHTVDQVTISCNLVPKMRSNLAIIQGYKPDGTLVGLNATAGGNFKVSVEEFDTAVFGQTTMSASLPVTIASDQTDIPITQLTHDNLNANVNLQYLDTDVTTTRPLPSNLRTSTGNEIGATTNGLDGIFGSAQISLATKDYNLYFNGSSWDRVRGDIANGADVDVTRIIPGTEATNLGKAEDATHVSGDVGVMGLGVRQDALSSLAGTDGDYVPSQYDADGALWVTEKNCIIDTGNSTTATLGNGGIFTGTGVDTLGIEGITVTLFADQDGASNGMQFEFSTDNVNWDINVGGGFDYEKDTGREFQFAPQARFFRVKFTNGVVGQGAVRIQTILHERPLSLTTIHRVDSDLKPDRSATVTKSVLMAQVGGSGNLVPIQASAAGILKTSGSAGGVTDTAYNEDSAAGNNDAGSFILAVRHDTAVSSVSADGDYTALHVDSLGRLWSHAITEGNVAHDAVDAGNPVKTGRKTTEYEPDASDSPSGGATEVAAGDVSDGAANRWGQNIEGVNPYFFTLDNVSTTYDNVTTTATSTGKECWNYRHARIFIELEDTSSAGAPTDIIFEVEVSGDGTNYGKVMDGPFGAWIYNAAIASSKIYRNLALKNIGGQKIRLKVTAFGTDASKKFTVTNAVIYLYN